MPRVCFTAYVKKDRLSEYKRRHAAVWPEMRKALSETGWRNYSLYLREDGQLIGYVEVDDFAAAKAAMAARDVNTRWQAEMQDFFEIPPGILPDQAFAEIEEVFHLE